MTLVEQIIKASTDPKLSKEPTKYPITFNADPIIQNLKPASEKPDPFSLIQPLNGFEIAGKDLDTINSYSQFYDNLKRLLKDPRTLSYDFIVLLNSFLERIAVNRLGDMEFNSAGVENYTAKLLVKFGSLVPRDLISLLIEAFILLNEWKLVETLIVNNLVDCWSCPDFLYSLIFNSQSQLICLSLRYISDIKASDLCRVWKYILSPSKDAGEKMKNVREEWESEALCCISKVREEGLSGKTLELAKDAAILLMMAYDNFTSPELCLHFLVSSNVDEVVFSGAISKLNFEEIVTLIKYLNKWLRKYERFPQAVPCPTAEIGLGLKLCKWVPKLEDVVRCLGLVVDERFSSLALQSDSELHQGMYEIVSSLVLQGRFSCSIANVIEVLKPEIGGM